MADLELSRPDHLTADFVGTPGQRAFYLQAAEGPELVTLLLEKGQVAELAGHLVHLLSRFDAAPSSEWDRERMRLREPVEPRWRVGTLSIGVDPAEQRFAIEAAEFVPEDDPRQPADVRVWATVQQIADLAAHAIWSVGQGRPACQFCGGPIDPDGHTCPAMNGHGGHDHDA